jgi:hypothetical protein
LRTKEEFTLGDFHSKAFDNDVFAFKRSHNRISHVILINFGSTEHTLNVNEIDEGSVTLPLELKVTVAGSKTSYRTGDKIADSNKVVLKAYDAIVLTDSASSIFGSIFLLVASILIKYFL